MARDPRLTPARQAAVLAGAEAVGIVIFAVFVGLASFHSSGTTTGASPVALVVLYLAFAACAGLVARGLWRRSDFARTPMGMLQVFGLVAAYPMLKGNGFAPAAGVVVAAVSLVGLWLTMRPATGADLRGDLESPESPDS